jgi:Putative transmembrane protein (PGPGW)
MRRWVRTTLDSLGLRNWPFARKVVVGVIGGTVLLFGVALIFLPGPSSIVIPLGLLILASEFAWARWLVHRGKKVVSQAKDKWRDTREGARKP